VTLVPPGRAREALSVAGVAAGFVPGPSLDACTEAATSAHRLGPAPGAGAGAPLALMRLPSEPPTDFELMQRAQDGHVESFAALYDRHAPVALALAKRILSSLVDAQDLLHDVFIEAWQGVREYDPKRASVRTWLLVRTRSRALDRVYRRGRERLVHRSLAPVSPSVADAAPHAERSFALREALAGLDDGVRSVLELTYFWGLTASEISERIDVPEGTVRSRLARGLSRLEQTLSELEGTQHG
jgi:RNA polymerase sigma-70 factor (ECF subfamily)